VTSTTASVLDAPGACARYGEHVSSAQAVLARLSPVGEHVEVEARGAVVIDDAGTRYLDCGGQGVFLLGHRHPAVVEAVKAQLDTQPLQSRFLPNPVVAAAAERLTEVAPPGLKYVQFHCSGTDVVEMAIKLARLAGRRHLVAMRNGFHGKTMGALTLTGRPAYRDPFEPLLPDVTHVAFGDLDALAEAIRARPGECCVVLEPVQSEAGVIVPPAGYLGGVERLCADQGAVLVLDEIQTGLGRLGAWWGATAEDIRPDILLAGKILGGGVMPASALLASEVLFEPLNRDPYLHSSTFANAPLVAAAARATIELLATTDVIDRAAALGDTLLGELRRLQRADGAGVLTDVRGAGLLMALEFESAAAAGEFLLGLLGERVLPSWSLNDQRTIRLTPSALMSDDEVAWMVHGVERALAGIGAAL
jgi:putrescine aminotransferase